MPGTTTPLILADIAIPSAWQCLVFAAPFLAAIAVCWLINRTDQIINHLFPDWEWERRLGWLNIRARRRAEAALRWIGYGIYAILAAALYGIVWGAQALPTVGHWNDPNVLGDVALRLAVLLVCFGVWLVYLGCGLIPKLRDQQEKEDLEKFRAETDETEKEREARSPSRLKSPEFGLRAPSDRRGPRR